MTLANGWPHEGGAWHERDQRELLTEVFERAGFLVKAVESCAEGRVLLEGLKAHVLIADKHVRDGSATELVRSLRDDARPLLTILLTGAPASDDALVFDIVCAKPMHAEALVALVRAQLEKRNRKTPADVN